MARSPSSSVTTFESRSQSKEPNRTGGPEPVDSWTQTGSPGHSTTVPWWARPDRAPPRRSASRVIRPRSRMSTGTPGVGARSTTSTPNRSRPATTGAYSEAKGNGRLATSWGKARIASSTSARWTGCPERWTSATGNGRFVCIRHHGRNNGPGSPTRTASLSSPGVPERRYTPPA